jgi:hypothetical protein
MLLNSTAPELKSTCYGTGWLEEGLANTLTYGIMIHEVKKTRNHKDLAPKTTVGWVIRKQFTVISPVSENYEQIRTATQQWCAISVGVHKLSLVHQPIEHHKINE